MKPQAQIHDVREHPQRNPPARVRRNVRETIILQFPAQASTEPQSAVNDDGFEVPIVALCDSVNRHRERNRRRDVRKLGRQQKHHAHEHHQSQVRLVLRPQVRQELP